MITACPWLDDIVHRALLEDLGAGDVTTEATVEPAARARAVAIARCPMIACGADVFARVFYAIDPGLRVEQCVADGTAVDASESLWVVEGAARSILMGERTALNFVQHLSGISTLVRRYVAALPAGSRTRITDTRKTLPGLRALQRYAVRQGGGKNHRDCLGAAVLVKDNHIVAAGSIGAAVERARARAPHTCRIEVEVETFEQLEQALAARADIVMLDNWPLGELAAAVKRASGAALIEVSGGITLERIPELASHGVDFISVGALTHSAPAADIGLDLERIG